MQITLTENQLVDQRKTIQIINRSQKITTKSKKKLLIWHLLTLKIRTEVESIRVEENKTKREDRELEVEIRTKTRNLLLWNKKALPLLTSMTNHNSKEIPIVPTITLQDKSLNLNRKKLKPNQINWWSQIHW